MDSLENKINAFIEQGRCGSIAVLFSLSAIFWGFWANAHHVTYVKLMHVKSHPMHPLTGLCLFLSCLSLLSYYFHSEIIHNGPRTIVKIISKFSIISIVGGIYFLGEALTKKVFVFEQSQFFFRPLDLNQAFIPSPETAICLVLSGISISSLKSFSKKLRNISETSTLLFFGFTVMSLAQALSGTDGYFSSFLPMNSVGMAIPSAFAFLFLSIGIFCYQPRVGYLSLFFKKTVGSDVARKLVLKLVFLPVLIEFVVGVLVGIGAIQAYYRQVLVSSLIFGAYLYTTWESAKEIDEADTARKKN